MRSNAPDLSAPSQVRRPANVNAAAVLARNRGEPRSKPLPSFLRKSKADHDTAPGTMPVWRVIVLVLLPFVSGYYLSYLYRSIGALISQALVLEFALTPAHLGFLTSTYFLAFGIVQLPLGVWLDRFGPRRVQAVLLSVAACGAALFASAGGFLELALGRALIGLGVAGALMAGLKAIVLWFSPDRTALANGWFMMLGALGAVTATAPAEILVGQIGWRGMFTVLACVTAASALVILLIVPERHRERTQDVAAESVSIAAIYRDWRFWRLAPLSATCVGSAWALQGLWAAPWLSDVQGFERSDLVNHLLTMAIALSASALLLGVGAHRLRRRWGVSLELSFAGATGVALLAQLALVLRWPLPPWLPWTAIAGIGAGTVLSYSILTGMFPKSASARANGALNVLHVSMAFAVQYAVGLVVQQWPQEAGHYPPLAYQTALGINLALQVAAFAWFLRPARQSTALHLGAHPIHALASRLGVGPPAAMPYDLARLAWHRRMADARAQAKMWRATAFTSFAVLGLLCTCVGTTILRTPIAAHMLQPTEARPNLGCRARCALRWSDRPSQGGMLSGRT